jgi:hypothetical protein
MDSIKIRRLTNADLMRVIQLFKKVGEDSTSKITELFYSSTGDGVEKKDKKALEETGVKIVSYALFELYDRVTFEFVEWIASLVDKTYDEFMQMEAEYTIDIIEALVENEKRFFTRALQLSKTMKLFGWISKIKSWLSGIISE